MWEALSAPQEAWHFDLRCPPEDADRRTIDVIFERDGMFNAVLFWFKLELGPNESISTGPGVHGSGQSWMSILRPRPEIWGFAHLLVL